jgi:hypothetical protein
MSGLPGSRLTVGRSELVGVGGVPDNPIPLLGVGGIAEELCQGLAAADLENCGRGSGRRSPPTPPSPSRSDLPRIPTDLAPVALGSGGRLLTHGLVNTRTSDDVSFSTSGR